jgi:CRP-like cAMP-binding protein
MSDVSSAAVLEAGVNSERPLRPLPDKPGSADPGKSSRMEHNEALSKNLPFLNENDHLLIMSKSKVKTLRPGEVLLRQGMPCTALHMIRSGRARVERSGVKLAELTAGSVCGEMIVLDGSPASASIIVEEELTFDAIQLDDLQELFVSYPQVGSRFFRSLSVNLSKKLRATSAQLAALAQKKEP